MALFSGTSRTLMTVHLSAESELTELPPQKPGWAWPMAGAEGCFQILNHRADLVGGSTPFWCGLGACCFAAGRCELLKALAWVLTPTFTPNLPFLVNHIRLHVTVPALLLVGK